MFKNEKTKKPQYYIEAKDYRRTDFNRRLDNNTRFNS
nr:MAG TPA: hypothetical protein [Caudoviricetes sp.]